MSFLLPLLTALLKHQVKTWLGDDALGAAGQALADSSSQELQTRLDAWLKADATAERLRQAAQTADRYFQDRCDDPALTQALTLDFGTLPAVQTALADLPAALDARGVETALREALTRDLGGALTAEQIARGARLYAEALQDAVGTLKNFALPVLLQIARQTRDEQREGFAAVQQKQDEIIALLQAGHIPSDEQAALLEEKRQQGQINVQGDVTNSVLLIGSRNTVTLNAAQIAALRPRMTLPGDLPPGSYLPLTRNTIFTGREEALNRLTAALLPAEAQGGEAVVVTQALTGLGGVGKTQLAVEFAYRSGYRFRGVHWLDLHDPALLDEQIVRCGQEMGLSPWPEKLPDQVRLTLETWKADGPRLLILDNLEDPQAAQETLTRLRHTNLRLLLTARRRDWPPHLGLSPLPLDEFSPEESRAFLRKHLTPERAADEDLEALAGRLGYLPLALELAGRYLARQSYLTVADYLDRLEDPFTHRSMNAWRAEDLPNPTQHDLNLWATFQLSWQQVKGAHARRLFPACGYLAPNTPIPQAILQLTVPDPEDLGEAVAELVGLGLLKEGPAIHPLLAEFARALDGAHGLVGAHGHAPLRALADLAVQTNHEVDRSGNYALYAPLLPHVRAAAAHAEGLEPATAGRLWNSLGYHLRPLADYAGARAAYERALRIDEAAFGPDHPNVAIRLNNLGAVLQAQGDYAGARAAYERALRIFEKHLGKDHPNVATLANNLGLVLQDLGDYAGARAAYERALRIDEAAFGPDHPNVATDVNNLGGVLRALGEYAKARAAYERALRIWEQHLGTDHPHIAAAANNLGSVLQDMGDYAGARAAYERALRIDEAAFGPEHPNVAIRLNNLGSVLKALGDYAGARAAFERALRIWEQHLGADHPHVAAAANNLGGVLQDMGDYAGARAAFERALRIWEQTLPPEHPYLRTVRGNLASLDEGAKKA